MTNHEVDKVEIIVVSGQCNTCSWSDITSFRSTHEPHMDEMLKNAKDDLTLMHASDSPECNGQIIFSN